MKDNFQTTICYWLSFSYLYYGCHAITFILSYFTFTIQHTTSCITQLNVFLTVHHELTIHELPTWCTDYYLFIKYYSPLQVSSIKCSSSGGHSCIQAAYGTVTLYKSSWWSVDTQLEWELTGGGRLLVGRLKTPYQQPSSSSQFSL